MASKSKAERSSEPNELERLQEELERLRQEKIRIEAERDELRKENTELREKLEAQQRQMFRQAAPFRVEDKRKKLPPRRPGRKVGHVGAYRAEPANVDETVEAPLDHCPNCGGEVSCNGPIEQIVEDIPEVRPKVTRIITYTGWCGQCGTVATHHPRQMSEATGAAKVQIGPRALAMAVDLNKRLGLPLRKTCDVLKQHFGLAVTPGGVVHAEARLATKLVPAYAELSRQLQRSATVCSDETSWWVGKPRWLWVFTAPQTKTTLFRVDHRRNGDVVREVLGEQFHGVLSSDCLNIYDGLPGIQQKCYAHHLRVISKALEEAGTEGAVLRELKQLLLTAIALGKTRSELRPAEYRKYIDRLEAWADELIPRAMVDQFAQKAAHRIHKQRDHLFTFLRYPGVDATNNAAERALRPAVIARKLSCGNRTDRGKATWEVLASLAATAGQRHSPFARGIFKIAPMACSRPRLTAIVGRASR